MTDIGFAFAFLHDIRFWAFTAGDILGISLALFLAKAFTKTDKDFILGFLLIYLATFIIGISTQIWLLVIIGFAGGIYLTRKKD